MEKAVTLKEGNKEETVRTKRAAEEEEEVEEDTEEQCRVDMWRCLSKVIEGGLHYIDKPEGLMGYVEVHAVACSANQCKFSIQLPEFLTQQSKYFSSFSILLVLFCFLLTLQNVPKVFNIHITFNYNHSKICLLILQSLLLGLQSGQSSSLSVSRCVAMSNAQLSILIPGYEFCLSSPMQVVMVSY